METLETARLIIRNFKIRDWEALRETVEQFESSEFAPYDHPWPAAPDEIKSVAEWFASGDHYLAVCLKATGQYIGFVALNPQHTDGRREFNLGYLFDAHYHGQGYATEACHAAITRAFEHLHADRVVTGTAAANGASCRLLERLGLKKTAEAVTWLQKTPDGKPIQFLGCTYAINCYEWQAFQPA